MKKSRGIRKRNISKEKLRDVLINPQTVAEVEYADQHIAAWAKRIKDEHFAELKDTKGESDGRR